MSDKKPALPRMTINLNKETTRALKEVTAAQGVSYTEAIRRSIGLSKFLHDELAAGRKVVTMRQNNSDKREVVFKR